MALKNIFDTMKRQGYVVKPLDQFLLGEANKDNDRAFNVNAPSQIGKCLRARYYMRIGAEKDGNSISPRTQRIFDNGTKTHERLQEYMLKAEILLMDEVPVLSGILNIQGHTDGIISISNNEVGIIEIKSINDNGFKQLKDAKEEHKMQGLCYAYCIEQRRLELQTLYKDAKAYKSSLFVRMKQYAKYYQHLKGGSKHTRDEKIRYQCSLHAKLDDILFSLKTPITKVVFLYENKNDQELKEFCISTTSPENKELINQITSDCRTVNDCVASKEEPPRDGKNKSDNLCRWCEFKINCWN